ncbi:MAG: acyl-CoA synthetase FdrA [Acidimicrobiales bacterium]
MSAAIDVAHDLLAEMAQGSSSTEAEAVEPSRSIVMAVRRHPDASLALISTPGEFASYEAEKALRSGLNVMLFSDGIGVAEERRIKDLADERGLLVMGPDCGTAIVGGVPLAFANAAERGAVGIVGASGTGIQAVVCDLDRLGVGISHALGTGGHDLHDAVGGISMLRGLSMLAADPTTSVIVLVSKPPSDVVAQRALSAAADCGKPVVACFLGSATPSPSANVHTASSLESAATIAAELAGAKASSEASDTHLDARLSAPQQWIRGLYSGGTLCFEATLHLGQQLPDADTTLFSNTPIGLASPLDDPWTSSLHTLVDLGDDVFTRGRPHPMIDHSIRNDRMVAEADDPETAVLLIDVVLGFGSHPDPVAAMSDTLVEVGRRADARGAVLPVVANVVGTSRDPQGLDKQVAGLRELGVHTFRSHSAALRAALQLADLTQGAIR